MVVTVVARGGMVGAAARYLIGQAWSAPSGAFHGPHHLFHLHLDIQHLVTAGHPGTALIYVARTAIGAVVAVWVTANTTCKLVTWRTR
jgi:fluoride exporter